MSCRSFPTPALRAPLDGVRRLAAVVVCLLALAVSMTTSASRADAPPCGLPAVSPLWIDYLDGTVKFWKPVFAKPGLVLATPGGLVPPALRAAGAGTAYFDSKLVSRVGTPGSPADPATIVDTANKVYDTAVKAAGCTTPLIAENELWGASLPTPWLASNVTYRANVLALLTQLAARGAHPYLLVNSRPTTTAEAGDWWRQVAQVADVVREFFPKPAGIARAGAILGSRSLRIQMRISLSRFTEIGIPTSRLGVMLELGSGTGGRNGLQPASAWFQVVKLEVLAARQVASELSLPTVWSWGWATYKPVPEDADKAAAACVFLWTRDQNLCNGPAAAGTGFDTSLTAGQLLLAPDVYCQLTPKATIPVALRSQLADLTGDPAAAASAALGWAATASAATASTTDVDSAEQTVVTTHFGGDQNAFLAALEAAHTSEPIAREILADALRRTQIARTLPLDPPTDDEVQAFYDAHPDALARLVSVDRPVDWLDGHSLGFAVSGVAPGAVFRFRDNRDVTVQTMNGPIGVRMLSGQLPLSALAPVLARAGIAATVLKPRRDAAYADWLKKREQKLLHTAICAADDLPAAVPVDVTATVPFLRIAF